MRITSAQQIADLLGKDVLIRALVEFIRITPAAKIQPLPGACIFISKLPEIKDYDAIWTLRVTGLDGSDLDDVLEAIVWALGGTIQGTSVLVTGLVSDQLVYQVEADQQYRQLEAKLEGLDQRFNVTTVGQGLPGPQGEPGPAGKDGRDGIDGRDGKDGLDLDATNVRLGELQDVAVEGAQYGDYLVYREGKWVPGVAPQRTGGGGGLNLSAGQFQNQPLTWQDGYWKPGSTIQFDTSYTLGVAEGQIAWEPDEHTAMIGLNGIHGHLAHDTYAWCRNGTGATITKGQAVMFIGTLGASGRVLVAPMVADGTYPGYVFLGIAAENIASGEDGNIISYGKLKGYDTSGLPEQAILWCNPAVPGGLTPIEPTAPNLKLPVAAVISSKNNGTLMVRWSTGDRLQDLHDVEANGSKQDGDTLVWVAANNRWESQAPVVAEAPQDGNYYVRQNGAWVNLTTALTALNVSWS